MSVRWKPYRDENDRQPLVRCEPADLTPEEALFLALHVRIRFLERIAKATDERELQQWVEIIVAGFASLLHHCDMKNLDRAYQQKSPWVEEVQPPSVLPSELMMFLGGLSVDCPGVYEAARRRAEIQAVTTLLEGHKEWFELGAEKRRASNVPEASL